MPALRPPTRLLSKVLALPSRSRTPSLSTPLALLSKLTRSSGLPKIKANSLSLTKLVSVLLSPDGIRDFLELQLANTARLTSLLLKGTVLTDSLPGEFPQTET